MASVSKRGNSWRARAGTPRQSGTFDTEEEAWEWARKIEEGVRRGDPRFTEAAVPFGDWIRRYIEEEAPQWATGKDKISRLRNLLADPISKVKVNRLAPADFERLRDRLLKSGRRNVKTGQPEGLAPQTVRHYLEDCSAVWTAARRHWRVTTLPNVLHDTKIPPVSARRKKRVRSGTWDPIHEELKRHVNPFYAPFAEFLLETAMRVHEPLQVTAGDVDREGRVLVVKGKGGVERFVPLTPRALELLDEAVALRKKVPTLFAAPNGGRYDLSEYGPEKVWPLSYRGFARAWSKAREVAGDSTVWIHDLRRERANRVLEAGHDLKTAQIVTGHKDLRSLDEHYLAQEAREVAKRLAQTSK